MDLSDLQPVREPFKWDGKDYALVEPSAAAVKKYRQSTQLAAKITVPDGMSLDDMKSGKVPIKIGSVDMAQLGAGDLPYLADCLVEVTAKGDSPVKLSTVEGWGHRLVRRLTQRRDKLFPLEEMLGDGKSGETSSDSPAS